MTITDTLREQHKVVLLIVNEIQAAIIAADAPRIQQELKQLQKVLSAHLALEDAELYPGLHRMAVDAGSQNLAVVARQFASNMSRITDALLAFLRKYDRPIVDLAAFRSDWAHIVSALSGRIASEEGTLYPLYEKALRKKTGAAVTT